MNSDATFEECVRNGTHHASAKECYGRDDVVVTCDMCKRTRISSFWHLRGVDVCTACRESLIASASADPGPRYVSKMMQYALTPGVEDNRRARVTQTRMKQSMFVVDPLDRFFQPTLRTQAIGRPSCSDNSTVPRPPSDPGYTQ